MSLPEPQPPLSLPRTLIPNDLKSPTKSAWEPVPGNRFAVSDDHPRCTADQTKSIHEEHLRAVTTRDQSSMPGAHALGTGILRRFPTHSSRMDLKDMVKEMRRNAQQTRIQSKDEARTMLDKKQAQNASCEVEGGNRKRKRSHSH